MHLHLSKTQRGGNVPAYKGFEYIFKKKTFAERITWKCRYTVKFRCHGKVTTEGDEVTSELGFHTHPADCIQAEANAALSVIKEAASSSWEPTQRVVGQVLQNTDNNVQMRMPLRSASTNQFRENGKK